MTTLKEIIQAADDADITCFTVPTDAQLERFYNIAFNAGYQKASGRIAQLEAERDEAVSAVQHLSDGQMVRGVPGVVEWILANNGTVKQFNQHVLMCEVLGVKCRYFITEGWIGVKTENCPSGKAIECLTLDEFVSTVEKNTP